MMRLPSYVQKALDKLESGGYEAYVVGGAVRDYLLNKEPNDYDVSTNARPDEVREVFARYRVFDTGIKHGTVSVMIERKMLEITTYRSEEDYEDFRHPKKVTFVRDLDTDLKRRDFTITALAYNRKIIDRVGGIADLKSKIIRAIGDPEERFTEDPLRILRALRFAAELGFTIEPSTAAAVLAHAGLIAKVSAERINIELNKLLAAPAAAAITGAYFPVIRVFIPEYRALDPAPHLAALKRLEGFHLRLAAFFLPLGASAPAVMRRLKYSRAAVKKTGFLVDNFSLELSGEEERLVSLLLRYDYRDLIDLIDLRAAYSPRAEDAAAREGLMRLYRERECFRLKDLKIGGRDLLAIGFKEGVGVRLALERILSEVALGKLPNRREALLKRAGEIKKEG